ncbi:hypothetical protein PCASD_24722 [Puccinia coronata f. sp. avenae]|uniref:Reverse transcriptase/retrotransposon-derived protein RNase H-like domain-containing protein n=1 Tax=Puccinia coronata f. sp. avenae TaxID=200324 RepID=A0A2N5TLM0_9BASI|nr:hypothetical protein PCASD_24722 [Puccinia coronata f. sp. avenae]
MVHVDSSGFAIAAVLSQPNEDGIFCPTAKYLSPKQARWALFLDTFNLQIHHVAGMKNPADAPSQREDFKSNKVEIPEAMNIVKKMVPLEDVQRLQKEVELTSGSGQDFVNCHSYLFVAKHTEFNNCTAGINRSNTAARAVLKQPCSTGGRTDTVRPKREPTGRTDLSDRSRLVLCNRSQELIGQACPTRRQVLRSDSACPTTGRTRLFKHRSNCRV